MSLSQRRKTIKNKENLLPHVMIFAGAGTGKTTTLVEGIKTLHGICPKIVPSIQQQAIWDELAKSVGISKTCLTAFNKAIQLELEKRIKGIPNTVSKTMHGLGYSAVLQRWNLDKKDPVRGERTSIILEEIVGKPFKEIDTVIITAVNKLVGLCKSTLVEPTYDNIMQIAGAYDVEMNESALIICDYVQKALVIAMNDVERHQFIDYNDMIWLPIVHNLTLPKFDLLLVDEAQDLNRCQQELVIRMGRRLIICGDPYQAIYGFAGADNQSMPNLFDRLNKTPAGCVSLKLNQTRRCGKAIVLEANKIVEDYQYHESNPEGKVCVSKMVGIDPPIFPIALTDEEGEADYLPGHNPATWSYHTFVKPGDMILCRVNALLVSQCFQFLKKGKKATIQGRDIGQGLVNMIMKMKASSLDDLEQKIERWYDREYKKETEKKFPSEARLIALGDKKDCICCFIEQSNSVEQMISKIYSIFTDDSRGSIILSSIHKAKGLEADQVFILDPQQVPFPHPMAKTPQAIKQEYNLRYVAITRAIHTLVYVR